MVNGHTEDRTDILFLLSPPSLSSNKDTIVTITNRQEGNCEDRYDDDDELCLLLLFNHDDDGMKMMMMNDGDSDVYDDDDDSSNYDALHFSD